MHRPGIALLPLLRSINPTLKAFKLPLLEHCRNFPLRMSETPPLKLKGFLYICSNSYPNLCCLYKGGLGELLIILTITDKNKTQKQLLFFHF